MDFMPADGEEGQSIVRQGWDRLAGAIAESEETGSRPARTRVGLEEKDSRPARARVVSFFRPARVAAMVGGIALIGAAAWILTRQGPGKGQLIAKNGEKIRQMLPDSSFVWLNAATQLTYASDYGKTRREVYLQGEAFFEVAPDKDRPFLVHAGKLIVKVLGTSFNVRSYAGDSAVETTLIKGKVEVQLNDGAGKHILLSPNEKLTVSNEPPAAKKVLAPPQPSYTIQPLIHLNDTTGYNEIAWIDNKLVFWNESFEKVAEKMERWYDVRIHFSRPALMQEALSGTFEKETVEQALKILQMTTEFTFSRNGKDIFLK